MSIDEALENATKILSPCEFITRPRLESELLLAFVLEKPRTHLHIYNESILDCAAVERFFEFINRRKNGEPVEYLTNTASFFSMDFFVDNRVLIPRPETEILAECAIKSVAENNINAVIDIGTGSGILAIVIAKRFPNLRIFALDISKPALAVAQINAKKHGTSNINFKQSNLLKALDSKNFNPSQTLIISNPPYISDSYKIPKPLEFEPQNALFGGEVGDEILRQIIIQSPSFANTLICEMGFDQREKIIESTQKIAHKSLSFYQDLSGFERGFKLVFA